MKKLIPIVVIFLLQFLTLKVVKSQDFSKCKDFKYGKFTFPLTPEGSGYAIRQNNIQTSYIREGEKQLVWDVKWKDECHYVLTLKEIYDESGLWSIGDKIEVEINSFKKNCYGYKAKLNIKNEDQLRGPKEFYDMMCKENEL